MPAPQQSFELFPPRSDYSALSLGRTIDRLAATGPRFFSVTFGAGGSTRDRSLAVLRYIREHTDVTPMAHLTAVGSTRAEAAERVREFLSAGVQDFLALRGDPPIDETEPVGEFGSAAELVDAILAAEPAARVGVAAFPNGHPKSVSRWQDVDALKAKQDAGASLAITQIFFRADDYLEYVSRARDAGVAIPIVPGIAPITRPKQLRRIAELNGQGAPVDLVAGLDGAGTPEAAAEVGVEYSAGLAVEVLRGGAPWAHYFTFNEYEPATRVNERVAAILG